MRRENASSAMLEGIAVAHKGLPFVLNSIEIQGYLKKLGFREAGRTKKVIQFKHNDLAEPFYVKSESINPTSRKASLVIHPRLRIHKSAIEQVNKGVSLDTVNFYHNSNLTMFDKRRNTGATEISYGINVDVESYQALKLLTEFLMSPDRYSAIRQQRTPNSNTEVSNVSFNNATSHANTLESTDVQPTNLDSLEPGATTQDALIQARVGQGLFRQRLIEYWGGCAVSEVRFPTLLRASHIKPWSESNDQERLDVFNGILLNPTLDLAFDRGYISFANNGQMLISHHIKSELNSLKICPSMTLKHVDRKHIEYLEWHREHIFKA